MAGGLTASLRSAEMLTTRSGWLLTLAACSFFAFQTARADLISLGDWQREAKTLGDKKYTWMSGSTDLDPEAMVLFQELPEDSSHSRTFLGDLSPYDTYYFAYEVEVISGELGITSIALSATMNHEGFFITKDVFLTPDDLNARTNSIASLRSDDGAEVGPIALGWQRSIYILEQIDQTGGGTFSAFSNTIHQAVPEPSTWLLSAFAAGGVALVHRRRKSRPVDVNRAA